MEKMEGKEEEEQQFRFTLTLPLAFGLTAQLKAVNEF
jgi:hypothetical protein